MSSDPQLRNHAAFIWSVADKLRGVYKQLEYRLREEPRDASRERAPVRLSPRGQRVLAALLSSFTSQIHVRKL